MGARPRLHTTKQMGDACEQLIAGDLTLAGVPAMKAPDNWPGYDVIAQPPGQAPQRISVKSRHHKVGAAYVSYDRSDVFDWLAIVILPSDPGQARAYYLIPRSVTDARFSNYKLAAGRGADCRIQDVDACFAAYRNNFALASPDSSPVARVRRDPRQLG